MTSNTTAKASTAKASTAKAKALPAGSTAITLDTVGKDNAKAVGYSNALIQWALWNDFTVFAMPAGNGWIAFVKGTLALEVKLSPSGLPTAGKGHAILGNMSASRPERVAHALGMRADISPWYMSQADRSAVAKAEFGKPKAK